MNIPDLCKLFVDHASKSKLTYDTYAVFEDVARSLHLSKMGLLSFGLIVGLIWHLHIVRFVSIVAVDSVHGLLMSLKVKVRIFTEIVVSLSILIAHLLL